MKRFGFLALGIVLVSHLRLAAEEAVPDFDREIAPILASRCLDCHHGATKEGSLDLGKLEGALAGGDSGAALDPKMPLESLLWQRIEQGEMPPKKHFPEEEKTKIKAWLEAGAKWGTSPIDPYKFTTSSRAGVDWWSLQPLKDAATIKAQANGKNPIDYLVQKKLMEAGLHMSPPAERAALLRRLSFDLIGLPPTPAEVQAFVQDRSPDAYAKQVQRLLDSPHYGERWARHWLDIAHFGESDGFEYDKIRPHAWRYRDWVIAALNQDMPYDEFARLQIAGDVLKPGDPHAVTATGFLVAGAHDSLLPASETMRMIMRQDELEDVVATVGQTFLGVTVHCARCHDHKFDPILQSDYYHLASALAGVRRGDRPLPLEAQWKPLQAQQSQREQELTAIVKPLRDAILAKRKADSSIPASAAALAPYAQWNFSTSAEKVEPTLPLQRQEQTQADERGLLFEADRPYAVTVPLNKDLREKTLVAVVRLQNLDQRGSGVIGVETLDGGVFDSIVFGERTPGHWMAGSNNFARTQDFAGSTPEKEALEKGVHFAIVYSADGSITAYREGKPYGKGYQSQGPQIFKANEAHVVFGLRHAPSGPGKHLSGQIERAAVYDRALSEEEVAAEAGKLSDFVRQEDLQAAATPQQRESMSKLKAEIETLKKQIAEIRETKSFAITPQQPGEPTKLLVRGNPLQATDVMVPAGLSALKHAGPDFGLPADAPEGERRIRLANWIASEKNPLFVRTIVNRVWQYHFGRGMVDTPSDLGFSGGMPTHPELLDYLASEFIASGFHLKALHKQIVLSQTYQQSSAPQADAIAKDADNRLLWRHTPRRLEAEAIRDAMLCITDQLNPAVGGISYQDFRAYIYKSAQFFDPLDPVGPEFNRRSVYRMWARGGKNPLLDTFDCPDPSTAAPKRSSTTTPLQALSMLNNSFTLRMSEDFSKRVLRDAGDDVQKQAAFVFELAYGRAATEAEMKAAVPFVKSHGLPALCRVVLNTNGFLYLP